MKTLKSALIVGALLLWVGCDPGAKQARGFRLPEGDAKAGRTAFTKLGCNSCHTVDGVDLPAPASKGQFEVKLGGQVHRVRSYGDLVTAIIHPAHDITKPFVAKAPAAPVAEGADEVKAKKSPMPDFNHIITVQQLVDLTTFLHSRYQEMPIEDYTHYF